VREFAGGWFGKAAYQRGVITEADAGRYAAYALKKIRAVDRRGIVDRLGSGSAPNR
jgi:hypothetical protein